MPATLSRPNIAQARAAAIAACERIDGWLTEREAGALFDLAAAATGPILEIGTWQGRSTAALALGSMAGNGQPVYTIDSYAGVPPTDRETAQGRQPGWSSSSPEQVRRNLDSVGVNGLVNIVPVGSEHAYEHVPDCAVLFVDGAHDYESVCRDLRLYLPKIAQGGTVIVHDCWELDPDVVRAVDENLMGQPQTWRMRGRVDSAIIATKNATIRHKVLIGFPGGSMIWGTAKGLINASLGAHDVTIANSANGWDDMNYLWVQALNAFKRGAITHFAMLHSDVAPDPGWVDTLLCELDEREADLMSVAIPLKDRRGLTSSGIGDGNPWCAFRRFTVRELLAMPETFDISDTPHPEKYLLHNTGCWVCDLRSPVFHALDEQGYLKAFFNFPLRVRVGDDGEYVAERESEDWFFSRQLAESGAKTCITRKVEVNHVGNMEFSNSSAWGLYEHDEDTRINWDSTEPVQQ